MGDRGSSPDRIDFILFHSVLTDPGSNPSSYLTGIGDCLRGVKRQGRKADHSPSSSAKVKNMWSYTFTSPYVLMVHC
jgi:hypothetical protein